MRVCCGWIGAVGVNWRSVSTPARSAGASGSMTMRAILAPRAHTTSESTASAVAGTGPRGTYASRANPTDRSCTLAIAPPGRRILSIFQPARDCTSPQAHDCNNGAGDALSSSSPSHRSESLMRSSRTGFGDERRVEMTRVVDTADDHVAVALFDDRDGCVLNLEWEEAAARPADDTMQRDLNHAAVRDDDHITVVVTFKDVIERSGDPRLEKGGALAARHQAPVGLFRPPRPSLRKALGQVVCAQAFPVSEVDLAQAGHRLGVVSDRGLDRLRRLERSLQVARVEAREPAPGKALPDPLCLAAPLNRERRVELSLDPVLTIPCRLAVANKHQPRGRRPCSER